MEHERVEMSVGEGLVNGNHGANGVNVNGAAALSKQTAHHPPEPDNDAPPLVNGARAGELSGNGLGLSLEAPEQMLNMISTELYLPMSKLVSRAAQECWNDLVQLVDRLAKMPVPAQLTTTGLPLANDQTKANLEKKDALLQFGSRYKAIFIKLMVLLQWSKRGEDVRKTIELNYWLVQRRAAFTEATFMIGQMMQDLANSQIPNPDLYTAAEVLALGRVPELSALDHYLPQPRLSAHNVLRTLRHLDHILCSRLALATDIPDPMRQYRVHDGRVTFSVPGEFDVDLSVVDESYSSKFFSVDFRFSFTPAPSVPPPFVDEICGIANNALDKDGLVGAYDLLHDVTLSCKLSELYQQAQGLARGLWAGHLQVELLRRTLVVQYWTKRPGPKSWIEIGIHSGRDSKSERVAEASISELRLRWLPSGKLNENHHISINQVQLSSEDIMRQVISHHINSIFGAIYDRFLQSPLYADGELEIEQTSDPSEPVACVLDIQLSKTSQLESRMECISGAMVLSPVSDRTNRVQGDLARSKNVIDDFVTRISSLRCAVAETKIHAAMPTSGWQHLPGLRLAYGEMEALFSQPVVRSNFYRQPHWLPGWVLAVTQSTVGDFWWLTRQLDTKAGPRLTQVVRGRPLHLEGPLTLGYLERLADYTSGVIVLQSNAEYLSKHQFAYRLPEIPRFSQNYKLPSLRFEARSAPKPGDVGLGSCIQREVELTYRGADYASSNGVVIARANFTANATSLKELAASYLDSSVSISPQTKQVMIRHVAQAGSLVIEEIVSKLKHVDNIVACAATVKRSLHHTLQAVSLSSITILYKSDPKIQYRLVINFATLEQKLRITFLPAEQNPHQHMATFATQLLTRRGQSLSKNLEDVLALLRMTQPLITYLYGIQRPTSPSEHTLNPASKEDLVRVHVLPRQAASYALHYFSKSENFPRNTSDAETPKKLLARLEILPKHRGQKTWWVVRPAIEEFNAYNRPSFTSNTLREKIQREIFGKQDPDWLRLDEGAAVSSEQPEKLLSRIHASIVGWLSEALDTTVQPELKDVSDVNGVKGEKDVQTAKSTGNQQQQKQPQHQNQQATATATANAKQQARSKVGSGGGGNVSQGPRAGQKFTNTNTINKNNTMKNSAGKAQEVITLD